MEGKLKRALSSKALNIAFALSLVMGLMPTAAYAELGTVGTRSQDGSATQAKADPASGDVAAETAAVLASDEDDAARTTSSTSLATVIDTVEGVQQAYVTLYDSSNRIVDTNDPEKEADDGYSSGGWALPRGEELRVYVRLASIVSNGANGDGTGIQDGVTYSMPLPSGIVPRETDESGATVLDPEAPTDLFRHSSIEGTGGIYTADGGGYELRMTFSNTEGQLDVSGDFQFLAKVPDDTARGTHTTLQFPVGGTVGFNVAPADPEPEPEPGKYSLQVSGARVAGTYDQIAWTSTLKAPEGSDGYKSATIDVTAPSGMGFDVDPSDMSTFAAGCPATATMADGSQVALTAAADGGNVRLSGSGVSATVSFDRSEQADEALAGIDGGEFFAAIAHASVESTSPLESLSLSLPATAWDDYSASTSDGARLAREYSAQSAAKVAGSEPTGQAVLSIDYGSYGSSSASYDASAKRISTSNPNTSYTGNAYSIRYTLNSSEDSNNVRNIWSFKKMKSLTSSLVGADGLLESLSVAGNAEWETIDDSPSGGDLSFLLECTDVKTAKQALSACTSSPSSKNLPIIRSKNEVAGKRIYIVLDSETTSTQTNGNEWLMDDQDQSSEIILHVFNAPASTAASTITGFELVTSIRSDDQPASASCLFRNNYSYPGTTVEGFGVNAQTALDIEWTEDGQAFAKFTVPSKYLADANHCKLSVKTPDGVYVAVATIGTKLKRYSSAGGEYGIEFKNNSNQLYRMTAGNDGNESWEAFGDTHFHGAGLYIGSTGNWKARYNDTCTADFGYGSNSASTMSFSTSNLDLSGDSVTFGVFLDGDTSNLAGASVAMQLSVSRWTGDEASAAPHYANHYVASSTVPSINRSESAAKTSLSIDGSSRTLPAISHYATFNWNSSTADGRSWLYALPPLSNCENGFSETLHSGATGGTWVYEARADDAEAGRCTHAIFSSMGGGAYSNLTSTTPPASFNPIPGALTSQGVWQNNDGDRWKKLDAKDGSLDVMGPDALFDPYSAGTYRFEGEAFVITVRYSGNMSDNAEGAAAPLQIELTMKDVGSDEIGYLGLIAGTEVLRLPYYTAFDAEEYCNENSPAPDASTTFSMSGSSSATSCSSNFLWSGSVTATAALSIDKTGELKAKTDDERWTTGSNAGSYSLTVQNGVSSADSVSVEDHLTKYIGNATGAEYSSDSDLAAIAKASKLSNLTVKGHAIEEDAADAETIYSGGTWASGWEGSTIEVLNEAGESDSFSDENKGQLFKATLKASDGVAAEYTFEISYDLTVDLDAEIGGGTTLRESDHYDGGTIDLHNNASASRAYAGLPYTATGDGAWSVDGGTLTVWCAEDDVVEGLFEQPHTIKRAVTAPTGEGHSRWAFMDYAGYAGKSERNLKDSDKLLFDLSGMFSSRDDLADEQKAAMRDKVAQAISENMTVANVEAHDVAGFTKVPTVGDVAALGDGTLVWKHDGEFDSPEETTYNGKAFSAAPSNTSARVEKDGETYWSVGGIDISYGSFDRLHYLAVLYDFDIDWSGVFSSLERYGISDDVAKDQGAQRTLNLNAVNVVAPEYEGSHAEVGSKVQVGALSFDKSVTATDAANGAASWALDATVGDVVPESLTFSDEVSASSGSDAVKGAAEKATAISDAKLLLNGEIVYENGALTDAGRSAGFVDGDIALTAEGRSIAASVKGNLAKGQAYRLTYGTTLDKQAFATAVADAGGSLSDCAYGIDNSAALKYGNATLTDAEHVDLAPEFPVTAKKETKAAESSIEAADTACSSFIAAASTGEIERRGFKMTDKVDFGDNAAASSCASVSAWRATVGGETYTDSQIEAGELAGATLEKSAASWTLAFEELPANTEVTVEYSVRVDRDGYIAAGGALDSAFTATNGLSVTCNDGSTADASSNAAVKVKTDLNKGGEEWFIKADNGNTIIAWHIDADLVATFGADKLGALESATIADKLDPRLGVCDAPQPASDDGTTSLPVSVFDHAVTATGEIDGSELSADEYSVSLSDDNTLTVTLNDPASHPCVRIYFATEVGGTVDGLANSAEMSVSGRTSTAETAIDHELFAVTQFGNITSATAPVWSPAAVKTVDDAAPSADELGKFAFAVQEVDEQGDPISGYSAEATNGDGGKVEFGSVQYVKTPVVGTHYYRITETSDSPLYVNDAAEWTVRVDVRKADDGTYSAEQTIVSGAGGAAAVAFDNKTKHTSFTVEKAWDDNDNHDGIRPSWIAVKLLDGDGNEVASHDLKATEGWKYTFENIPADRDGYHIEEYTVEDASTPRSTSAWKVAYGEVSKTTSADGVTTSYSQKLTNTHESEASGSFSLTGVKSLTGRAFADGDELTFHVSGKVEGTGEAAPLPANVDAEGDMTVKAPSGETAFALDFGSVDVDAPYEGKTLVYEISETGASAAGMHTDAAVKTVKVKIGHKAHSMDMTCDISGDEITFSNEYVAASGEFALSLEKTVNGSTPAEGQTFSFAATSTDEGAPELSPVTTDAAGKATFAAAAVGDADEGKTYTYTIHETSELASGWTRAGDVTATVTVGQRTGDDKLPVAVTYSKGATAAAFDNGFTPAATALGIEKTVNGGPLEEGESFTFSLLDASGKQVGDEIAATKDSPKALFDELTFDSTGTYEFTIHETSKLPDGWTNAPDIEVKLTVEGIDGKLAVTDAEYTDGRGYDSDGEHIAQFDNSYETTGNANIKVAKTVNGGTAAVAGEKFEFQLLDESGKAVSTATSAAGGTASFAGMSYTTADVGKTFEYTIHEVGHNGDGWTADSDVKATVKVTTNAAREVIATTTYSRGENAAEFTNTYAATGTATISVYKTVNGGTEAKPGERFTFELYKADESGKATGEKLGTVETEMGEVASFGELTFDHEGVYTYIVHEVASGRDGWTDAPDVAVTVTAVDKDGKGALSSTVAYGNKDGEHDAALFDNGYAAEGAATLKVSKTVAGGTSATAGEEFEFQLLDENGARIDSVKAKAGETVSFKSLEYGFQDVGEHAYTIHEVGHNGDGWTADSDAKATVTVKDADGKLDCSVSYSRGEDAAEFTNIYAASGSAAINVYKTVNGGTADKPGEKFTFELYAADESGRAAGEKLGSVETEMGEVASFGELTFDHEGTWKYVIREVGHDSDGWTAAPDVTATVTAKDKGNGTLAVTVLYSSATDSGNAALFDDKYEEAATESDDGTSVGAIAESGKNTNSAPHSTIQTGDDLANAIIALAAICAAAGALMLRARRKGSNRE